jgi:hypothetical protein
VLTPVTMPLDVPTVAIPVDPLVHVPPGVGSTSVIVDPTQTDEGPDMGSTAGLTIIVVDAVLMPHISVTVSVYVVVTVGLTVVLAQVEHAMLLPPVHV